MRQKYKSMYENLDLRSGRSILLLLLIFFYRRYLLSSIVVFQNHLFLQITILILGVFANLIATGFNDAFLVRRSAYQEYANEVLILLTLYTFLCFTDLVKDFKMQIKIGNVSCLLLCLHLGINLTFMLASST